MKSIMIQGTASGVGKTIITMALCRIFKEDGYTVAPFKAQNMTSNTYNTANGDEIAVSQWLQATAAGVTPDTLMNPVLLKPSPDGNGTQIIVNGKPFDTIKPHNYSELKKKLALIIADAFHSLYKQYDIVVIEGAGSPVELNLNQKDIVNMGMAKLAKSPVILVSDIDRGGVFASLYGTLKLFTDTERSYVKATIVNRFRGDISLFKDGINILENITQLPVAGVIPYTNIMLPEEDGENPTAISTNFDNEITHIANIVRKSISMELIYEILQNGM